MLVWGGWESTTIPHVDIRAKQIRNIRQQFTWCSQKLGCMQPYSSQNTSHASLIRVYWVQTTDVYYCSYLYQSIPIACLDNANVERQVGEDHSVTITVRGWDTAALRLNTELNPVDDYRSICNAHSSCVWIYKSARIQRSVPGQRLLVISYDCTPTFSII